MAPKKYSRAYYKNYDNYVQLMLEALFCIIEHFCALISSSSFWSQDCIKMLAPCSTRWPVLRFCYYLTTFFIMDTQYNKPAQNSMKLEKITFWSIAKTNMFRFQYKGKNGFSMFYAKTIKSVFIPSTRSVHPVCPLCRKREKNETSRPSSKVTSKSDTSSSTRLFPRRSFSRSSSLPVVCCFFPCGERCPDLGSTPDCISGCRYVIEYHFYCT